MTELEQRVIELESKVAFLEHGNQQLSDLVYAQQQQLDRHMRDVARQIEAVSAAADGGDTGDEVPPHY